MGSKLEKIGCIESEVLDDGRVFTHKLIDSNNDLNLFLIKIDDVEIFDDEVDLDKELIQEIIDKYEPIVNKFIIFIVPKVKEID